MKKALALVLVLAMAFSMMACGSTDTGTDSQEMGSNAITDLVDQGYMCMMTSFDENDWRGYYEMQEGGPAAPLKVVAKWTADDYEAYNAISWEDVDMEQKQLAILSQLTDIEITDVSDLVPTQEDLDQYIGKTFGDLEDEGFYNTGWTGEAETGYDFYYDGPVFYCMLTPVGKESITDMDDYSTNDIRGFVIESIEFMGLSSGILDM